MERSEASSSGRVGADVDVDGAVGMAER
jgi:hypothetical protein